MTSCLLELEQIKKYYPIRRGLLRSFQGYVRAVDNVSIAINPGENLGLAGESGSGKTTLGKLILKLINADGGRIIFQGQEITHFSDRKMREVRKKMQVVFQDPFASLDPRFNVENIITEGMDENLYAEPSAKKERVRHLLNLVGLSLDAAGRFPHEFSGGERQRIAIARSLVNNPQFLIMDEAVSSLDILVQSQILHLLLNLQRQFNLTYLFISHNLRVLKKVCQRIAVMYKGKIIEMATTQEIFDNPLHPYTQELLSAAMDFKVRDKVGKDFFGEDDQGCCYNKVCARSQAVCFDAQAELKEIKAGHFVRCHLSGEVKEE